MQARDKKINQPSTPITMSSNDIRYDNRQLLGKGSYGSVYKGIYQETIVAIKIFCFDDEKKNETYFNHETFIMEKLNHPNVVRMIGTFTQGPDLFRANKSYCIVMEYLPAGNLATLLDSHQEIAWGTRLQIAIDIAEGIQHLHTQGVLHGDIKSTNILLGWHQTGSLIAKIADFGAAKLEDDFTPAKFKGTLEYAAPEIIRQLLEKNNLNEKEVTLSRASDVFAFGVILWELGARKAPLADRDGLIQLIIMSTAKDREQISDDTPTAMKHLIENCWAFAAEERPSIIKALSVLKPLAAECSTRLAETPLTAEKKSPPHTTFTKHNNDSFFRHITSHPKTKKRNNLFLEEDKSNAVMPAETREKYRRWGRKRPRQAAIDTNQQQHKENHPANGLAAKKTCGS